MNYKIQNTVNLRILFTLHYILLFISLWGRTLLITDLIFQFQATSSGIKRYKALSTSSAFGCWLASAQGYVKWEGGSWLKGSAQCMIMGRIGTRAALRVWGGSCGPEIRMRPWYGSSAQSAEFFMFVFMCGDWRRERDKVGWKLETAKSTGFLWWA